MAFLPKKMTNSQKGPTIGGLASLLKLKASFGKSSSIQRSPLIGGEASLAKVMEGLRKPVQKKELKKEVKKEVKKDPSVFQGKQYLTRPEISRLFKKDWAWKITKLPANIRSKLGEKLWNPKDPRNFGIYITRGEADKVLKDIENYPNRARSRYGIKNRDAVRKTRNLLRKFVGK